MWENFYSLVCKDLDQNFMITNNFEITRYMMGIRNMPRIYNKTNIKKPEVVMYFWLRRSIK
jgi:hypothetical protein